MKTLSIILGISECVLINLSQIKTKHWLIFPADVFNGNNDVNLINAAIIDELRKKETLLLPFEHFSNR